MRTGRVDGSAQEGFDDESIALLIELANANVSWGPEAQLRPPALLLENLEEEDYLGMVARTGEEHDIAGLQASIQPGHGSRLRPGQLT